eukprot:gene20714-27527_t
MQTVSRMASHTGAEWPELFQLASMHCDPRENALKIFARVVLDSAEYCSDRYQYSVDALRRVLTGKNVLVVGSGGREHALAWKLSQSSAIDKLFCAPGNPGMAAEQGVSCVNLNVAKHSDVVQFCKEKKVDMVLVGPEVPLCAGLADDLESAGIATWGPSRKAAQLEGSKSYLKDILKKYNIPTATYEKFTDPAAAKAFILELGAPIVVKTSGLAAGKGVTVAFTVEEALAAVEDMMVKKIYGDAGNELVIEEFLEGEEASFFALVDGEKVVPLIAAQDHKAVGEGDTGPNTGGMGTYSPAPVATDDILKQSMEEIMHRTAQAMVAEGAPFKGTLFAGLMIKDGKPPFRLSFFLPPFFPRFFLLGEEEDGDD